MFAVGQRVMDFLGGFWIGCVAGMLIVYCSVLLMKWWLYREPEVRREPQPGPATAKAAIADYMAGKSLTTEEWRNEQKNQQEDE